MRLTAAAIVLLVASPVAAETPKFPVSIPQECFELAKREGVPTTIENRYQATKAKFRLAQLSKADPLVRECRAAVHRAQEAMAASGSQQANAAAPSPAPVNQQTVSIGAQH